MRPHGLIAFLIKQFPQIYYFIAKRIRNALYIFFVRCLTVGKVRRVTYKGKLDE